MVSDKGKLVEETHKVLFLHHIHSTLLNDHSRGFASLSTFTTRVYSPFPKDFKLAKMGGAPI